jgi:hypothetical protein
MASAPGNRKPQATTPAAEQDNDPTPPSDKKPCRRSPVHPIPQLQGPFEESISEASQEKGSQWIVHLDAQSRRKELLENAEYERLCGRKWRQRAGERQVNFYITRSRALSLTSTNKLIGHRISSSVEVDLSDFIWSAFAGQRIGEIQTRSFEDPPASCG